MDSNGGILDILLCGLLLYGKKVYGILGSR
ncbi:hypothetical protein QFZ77_001464 [Paenibacillus sp. V4I3]|nr:hypothetical protein [Paenibacillus sp. V4I3]MDQ0891276.1 hypothetical protein [Paenibacillus sp. V4I9]